MSSLAENLPPKASVWGSGGDFYSPSRRLRSLMVKLHKNKILPQRCFSFVGSLSKAILTPTIPFQSFFKAVNKSARRDAFAAS